MAIPYVVRHEDNVFIVNAKSPKEVKRMFAQHHLGQNVDDPDWSDEDVQDLEFTPLPPNMTAAPFCPIEFPKQREENEKKAEDNRKKLAEGEKKRREGAAKKAQQEDEEEGEDKDKGKSYAGNQNPGQLGKEAGKPGQQGPGQSFGAAGQSQQGTQNKGPLPGPQPPQGK